MSVERRESPETKRNAGQLQGGTRQEEPVRQIKPFQIDKKAVMDAWLRIKANGGSEGVDGVPSVVRPAKIHNRTIRFLEVNGPYSSTRTAGKAEHNDKSCPINRQRAG
jgi:hypothetical protein